MPAGKKKQAPVTDEVEAPVATEENVTSASVLAELLGAVKAIKQEQQDQKAQFENEKAELEARVAAAENRANSIVADATRPNVLPVGSIDPRSDHPGTIQEKLQILEQQALENGMDFDKERTYRILRGLPVEPIEELRYMGRVFKTQEEMDIYTAKIDEEKMRTLGKYGLR